MRTRIDGGPGPAMALLVLVLAACGSGEEGGEGGFGAGGSGGTDGTGGSGGERIELPAQVTEVSFPAAGLMLEGTLHLPARREGARVPAVIFAHGSGPNSRDEALSGQLGMSFGVSIPVFAELAEALAEAGYATLRFDKRTCGPFNGCAENGYPLAASEAADVYTFIDDVEAGLDFLAGRDEIDPARLFFLGHSQGGGFAPELLSRRGELRAGVMLAGPYRPIDTMLATQAAFLRELLGEIGLTEAQIDEELADLELQVAQLAGLREGTFEGTAIGGVPVAFWRAWMRLGDEAPGLARALERPLLALSGDYDWNVPPLETGLWADLFAEREPPLSTTEVLPCITHGMNCISQPNWKRVRIQDIGVEVDPAVPSAVIDFLDSVP